MNHMTLTIGLIPVLMAALAVSADTFRSTMEKADAPLEAFFDHTLGAQIDESAIQQLLRVDPSGGGDYLTIAEAWNKVIDNLAKGVPTKLLLAPGTYREAMPIVSVVGKPAIRDTLLVIEGAGPEKTIWTGSYQTTPADWRQEGNGLYSTSWKHDWGNFCFVWEAPNVPGHRSEMVFVNGELMTQVLLEWYDYQRDGKLSDHGNRQHSWSYVRFRDPATTLVPSTFGVAEREDNGNRIFLRLPEGVSLADAKIEIAQHRLPFRFAGEKNRDTGKNQLAIRGITFQHFASRTFGFGIEQFPGIGWDYKNLLIENCNFFWNNAKGIEFQGTQITVRNVNASHNGFSGFGEAAFDAIFEDNITNFNNWRGAWGGLRGWNWGG